MKLKTHNYLWQHNIARKYGRYNHLKAEYHLRYSLIFTAYENVREKNDHHGFGEQSYIIRAKSQVQTALTVIEDLNISHLRDLRAKEKYSPLMPLQGRRRVNSKLMFY